MQARDLKSIIESENHELKTQFCNVPFTITPDRNIYNIIRNKYKELALEAQTKFAEINEQFEDLDDLINNAPSAFVYCIEKALKKASYFDTMQPWLHRVAISVIWLHFLKLRVSNCKSFLLFLSDCPCIV